MRPCNLKNPILCLNAECEICNLRRIPEKLINEFDKVVHKQKTGEDLNLKSMPFKNRQIIWWKCLHVDKHDSYLATIFNKQKSGCPKCVIENRRKLTPEEKQKIIESSLIPKISKTAIGDKTEQYVYNLLKDHYKIESCLVVGHIGCKADIVVKLFGIEEKKSLQVKTMSGGNGGHLGNYDDQMLIVFVNNERTKFAMGFLNEFDSKSACFSSKGRYNHMIQKDEKEFCYNIVEKIVESTPFTNIRSQLNKSQQKEYDMRLRLEKKCRLLKLPYRDHVTNGDTIDCFINDIPIQLKYSSKRKSRPNSKTVDIHSKKKSFFEGKSRDIPYHDNDPFEFVIVQIEGYDDKFCIIPKSELLSKLTSSVCFPDYTKPHKMLKYWNNFNQLRPLVIKHFLQKTCYL